MNVKQTRSFRDSVVCRNGLWRIAAVASVASFALPACAPEPGAEESVSVTQAALQAGDEIAGTYLVGFANDLASKSSSQATIELEQQFPVKTLKTFDHAIIGALIETDPATAQELAADPRVAYVEPDRVVAVDTVQSPAQWDLDRIDERGRKLDGSYTYRATGAGVHVFVVDTGLRASHVEFEGRATADFSSIQDGRGAADCHGHGTHVAGTLGGRTHGVAKGVYLHGVRVLDCWGYGRASAVIQGLDWILAHHGGTRGVVNMSLSVPAVVVSLQDAVRRLIAAGMVVVSAAGNSNADACGRTPANVGEAITVASSDSSDTRAVTSNWGPCVDLFAPGEDITSAWSTGDTAEATISGTSMAAPHVAGAAALYREINRAAPPLEVAHALRSMAAPGRVHDVRGTPNLLLYTGALRGARVSLRSFNLRDRYVRHANFLGETTPVASALDRADATFRLVAGLFGPGAVSFEATNLPGHYLRHQAFRVKLQPADGTALFNADASFYLVPGHADPAAISIESVNLPGFFVRHRDLHLHLERPAAAPFTQDATFVFEPPFVPSERRVSLEASAIPGQFLRHRGFEGWLGALGTQGDRMDATFRVVPGFVPGTSSLESVNFPGRFLRHQFLRLKLQGADGTPAFAGDASFFEESGLAGTGGLSLRASNLPGGYVRHRSFAFWVETAAGALFPWDATFTVRSAATTSEF